jgi:hypothetical protein
MKREELEKLMTRCPYRQGEDGDFRLCLRVICPFYAIEEDAYTYCKRANMEMIGRPE